MSRPWTEAAAVPSAEADCRDTDIENAEDLPFVELQTSQLVTMSTTRPLQNSSEEFAESTVGATVIDDSAVAKAATRIPTRRGGTTYRGGSISAARRLRTHLQVVLTEMSPARQELQE